MSLRFFHSQNKSGFGTNEVRLVVFNGESNSGGAADNADLTGTEAGARTEVQILNNTSLVFQNLDIGTNNLISHYGFTDNSRHGWENGLANQAANGDFETPIYLVKTGQGGSLIADWNTGGSYYNTMVSRVDTAISILEGMGKTVRIYWWYSLGINDALTGGGTATATWKSAVQAYFAQIRSLYGSTMPIYMTKFYSPMPTMYNTTIDEIDSADSYTYAIDTSTSSIISSGGYATNHWDYAGQKNNASLFIEKMLQ